MCLITLMVNIGTDKMGYLFIILLKNRPEVKTTFIYMICLVPV